MSDNSSEQEPSIEEILASIRQIISDDDEEEVVDSPTEKAEEEALADPIRHESDDILELTEDDLADEPQEIDPDDIDMQDMMADEPEPEPLPEPKPEPRPVPSDILSSGTQSAALGSLGKLTSKMPINSSRAYDGVTLEDIVREQLHPMLREWLDDNLPRMVERLVQKELEKLARRALDD